MPILPALRAWDISIKSSAFLALCLSASPAAAGEPLHKNAKRDVIYGHCTTLMVQRMNRRSLCPTSIALLSGVDGSNAIHTGGKPSPLLGVEAKVGDRIYRMFGFASSAQEIGPFDYFYKSGASGFGFWVLRVDVDIAGDITPVSTTTGRCEYVKTVQGKRAVACSDHRTYPTFLLSFVED